MVTTVDLSDRDLSDRDLGARDVVARVVDPEMPMLTLDDLGVVRSVSEQDGTVTVTITPTYSGCPAIEEMRADIRGALTAAGTRASRCGRCSPPPGAPTGSAGAGRRKLAEAGVAPPGSAPRTTGPIPLTLDVPSTVVPCHSAGRGRPRSCRASARPRAPRCAGARPAVSRSST